MPQDMMNLDAVIYATATIVGKKEHEGPLSACFDDYDDSGSGKDSQSDRFGQDTFEKAEAEMQHRVLAHALARAGKTPSEVDLLFAGDLMNQCTSSAYGLLPFDIPYVGLYGACSTCAEGLLMGASMVTGGLADTVAAVTSSHNAAAERQFRFPLEYGGQRPPTAQWTVTGAGAFVLGRPSGIPTLSPMAYITSGMVGIVVDKGINDANNMGAAMAPSAVSTLCRYFASSKTTPEDYDLIVTGDLGWEGGRIFRDLMLAEGYDITGQYNDCGMMIFSQNTQDTHCGGSGCGCSAVVLGGYLLPKLQSGDIQKMLFMATGALMSPDAIKQGRSIPGVAHLLCLESPKMREGGSHDTAH